MSYPSAIAIFDEETQLIVEVSLKFLHDYFGHPRPTAEGLICALLETHSDMYDEDFIHHESSYLLAAGAHYFSELRGERGGFRDWLRENAHDKTPPDALEYFRKTYFRS